MNKNDLHEYQRKAIDFIYEHKGAALFLDMGLGKTVTTLTALQGLMDSCDVDRVLVVAPKMVAQATWADEVEKWDHLRNFRVSVILGNEKQRREAMNADADIYVTSRDLFVKVLEAGFKFDCLVIDELTSFKNSASKRFKALKKIRYSINRVIGLTGTPTPNGYKDLWAQMYCIDCGRTLGHAKTKFLASYFNLYQRNGITIRYDLKSGAEREIQKRIAEVSMTMKASDYLNLPKKMEHTVAVSLDPTTRKRYEEFERDSILEFMEANADKPQSVIASNAGALCNKLQQYANGAIYNDEHMPISVHEAKMDALMEIIESASEQGEHVLVFYQFQHDLHRIITHSTLKGMNVRKYETAQDLRDWNDGKIEVLVTHAASTAYGLNLQRGGRTIVWYGTGYNAELYQQGNARLYRQGQTKPVVVYRLVVKGTVDEDATRAIDGKVATQDAMLESLKVRMQKYGTPARSERERQSGKC